MSVATILVLAQLADTQAVPVIAEDWAQRAAGPTREQAVAQAVRETLSDIRSTAQPRDQDGGALRGDSVDQFTALMAEARVPDCLHQDGLKRQPTGIGPFAIGGVLALPFVAVAKLRGKCN